MDRPTDRLAHRLIIVDGLPGTGRTELAQRLALQLEAAGEDVQMPMATDRGHPLRRAWAPDAYGSVAEFADALSLQWQNFAIRAAAEPALWISAAAWLEQPFALGATDASIADRIELATRLFSSVQALSPTLIFLSRPGETHDAAVADGAFAGLEAHRTLLNTRRLDAEQICAEALAFIGVRGREIALAPALRDRIAGRYGDPQGPVVDVVVDGSGLAVSGLPEDFGTAPRRLLPAVDGRLVVAGADIELRARLGDDGHAAGLLLRTSEPKLHAYGDFLVRSAD